MHRNSRRNHSNVRPDIVTEKVAIHGLMLGSARSTVLINPVLMADTPECLYNNSDPYSSTMHHGQRKLMCGEIDFLTRYAKAGDMIVYIGAAPGNHIPHLVKMFPGLSWYLIDGAKFKARFDKSDPVVTVTAMCDDNMISNIKAGHPEKRILMISDIRSDDSQEIDIDRDMESQMRWHLILNPAASSLKFRPTFGKESLHFEYLKGEIHLQTWAPPHSVESRLYVVGTEMATYDSYLIHRQMAYYNQVIRPSKVDFKVTNIKADDCHDCALEAYIIRRYLESYFYSKIDRSSNITDMINAGCNTNYRTFTMYYKGLTYEVSCAANCFVHTSFFGSTVLPVYSNLVEENPRAVQILRARYNGVDSTFAADLNALCYNYSYLTSMNMAPYHHCLPPNIMEFLYNNNFTAEMYSSPLHAHLKEYCSPCLQDSNFGSFGLAENYRWDRYSGNILVHPPQTEVHLDQAYKNVLVALTGKPKDIMFVMTTWTDHPVYLALKQSIHTKHAYTAVAGCYSFVSGDIRPRTSFISQTSTTFFVLTNRPSLVIDYDAEMDSWAFQLPSSLPPVPIATTTDLKDNFLSNLVPSRHTLLSYHFEEPIADLASPQITLTICEPPVVVAKLLWSEKVSGDTVDCYAGVPVVTRGKQLPSDSGIKRLFIVSNVDCEISRSQVIIHYNNNSVSYFKDCVRYLFVPDAWCLVPSKAASLRKLISPFDYSWSSSPCTTSIIEDRVRDPRWNSSVFTQLARQGIQFPGLDRDVDDFANTRLNDMHKGSWRSFNQEHSALYQKHFKHKTIACFPHFVISASYSDHNKNIGVDGQLVNTITRFKTSSGVIHTCLNCGHCYTTKVAVLLCLALHKGLCFTNRGVIRFNQKGKGECKWDTFSARYDLDHPQQQFAPLHNVASVDAMVHEKPGFTTRQVRDKSQEHIRSKSRNRDPSSDHLRRRSKNFAFR